MNINALLSTLIAPTMAGVTGYVINNLLRRRRCRAYRSTTEACIDVQIPQGGMTIAWILMGPDQDCEQDCEHPECVPVYVVVGFAFRAPSDTPSVRGLDTARSRCFGERIDDTWARVVLSVDLCDDGFYSVDTGLTAKGAHEAYRLMLRRVRIDMQQRWDEKGRKREKTPMKAHVPWWNQNIQTEFFLELEKLDKLENPSMVLPENDNDTVLPENDDAMDDVIFEPPQGEE